MNKMQELYLSLKNCLNTYFKVGLLTGLIMLLVKIITIIFIILFGSEIIAKLKNIFKKKNISNTTDEVKCENNEDILETFRKSWLKNSENNREKNNFYLWLNVNYNVHLKAHKKNKDLYFKEEGKINRQESEMKAVNKIVVAVSGVLTMLFGFLFSANANFFWEIMNNNGLFKNIPQTIKVLVLGLIIAVIMFGVFIFIVFFIKSEYLKKMQVTKQYRETWLRHAEAIQGYQLEMLGYIYNIGEYRNCGSDELKDVLVMERIRDVWQKNGNKFQTNMAKHEKKAENK